MKTFMRFPGFLTKAVTLSYDDGVVEDKQLIEIMRKHGVKGTFNLNSEHLLNGTVGRNSRAHTVEESKALFGEDTEIALHGVRHLSLAKVGTPQALHDIIRDRETLEGVFERVVRGMAYANGSFSDEVVELLKLSGVVYARTVRSTYDFDIPTDWLRLDPTCHHKDPKLFELLDKFLEDDPERLWSVKPKLFYLWGHSYEFPRDNNWDVIERFCERVGSREDIWHATNMEVHDYVHAFEALVFSVEYTYVYNPSAIDVYVVLPGNKKVIAKAGKTTKIV